MKSLSLCYHTLTCQKFKSVAFPQCFIWKPTFNFFLNCHAWASVLKNVVKKLLLAIHIFNSGLHNLSYSMSSNRHPPPPHPAPPNRFGSFFSDHYRVWFEKLVYSAHTLFAHTRFRKKCRCRSSQDSYRYFSVFSTVNNNRRTFNLYLDLM